MKAWAIVLCGGSGTRMGMGFNKTLLTDGDEPVFIKSLRLFKKTCGGTVLVTGKDETDTFRALCEKHGCVPDVIVTGGARRQDSVKNALDQLSGRECDTVLIHDGARCFVSENVINNVLSAVQRYGSAVAAVPVTDTIKKCAPDGRVLETPHRETLRAVQTPQGFRLEELKNAYRLYGESDVTDDAMLMEMAGYPVYVCDGDAENIKLTVKADLKRLQRSNEMEHTAFRAVRVGQGFDAHRLETGRRLVLCGVEIPYEKGLAGHSDADAALHALTDAMLGAAALPDIGHLFPDTDDRYLGISSLILLKEAYAKVREKGYMLGNADITVIAQRPKLAPYIDEMRKRVAEALETDIDNIAVKASTTEKMGYEGRGEGISAMAAVLLYAR